MRSPYKLPLENAPHAPRLASDAFDLRKVSQNSRPDESFGAGRSSDDDTVTETAMMANLFVHNVPKVHRCNIFRHFDTSRSQRSLVRFVFEWRPLNLTARAYCSTLTFVS